MVAKMADKMLTKIILFYFLEVYILPLYFLPM